MGRSIPSISQRLEARLAAWERFSKMLGKEEQASYSSMIPIIRGRRTAIDAADEADIGVAMLLALITNLKGELDDLKRKSGNAERPSRT
jgi:hypothetical protein